MQAVLTGNCGENQSSMYHIGYELNPQMLYEPYSSFSTPLLSSGGGQLYYRRYFSSACPYHQQSPSLNATYGQLYYTRYFSCAFPHCQQLPSSNVPCLHATVPASEADLTMPVERQGLLRSQEGTASMIPLPSSAASRELIGPVGSLRQGIISSSAMVSQQQTPFYASGSSINSYNQGYPDDGRYQHGHNFGNSNHRMINDGRSFIATDQRRQHGRENANERNRGPRAIRRKDVTRGVDYELYNMPDFNVDYKDAKFFIIKSYNEENIHMSIKHGVWSSTPNGNKKLDAAYCGAKKKKEPCPIFLFFSVNSSAQFCGIAEMIGCVDFDVSLDYWLHYKWNGMFPVKWHVLKDVPNIMFRHIILESNNNKPVTHSRDTQEVKLEKGLEMLGIFKKYETNSSILIDFEFYEEKEKAMEERKASWLQQQQQQLQQEENPQPSNIASASSARVVDEQLNPESIHNELFGQFTRNLNEVVRLRKDCGSSDKPPTSSATK